MKHYLYMLFIIPFLTSCYNVNSYSNYVKNETYTVSREEKSTKESKTMATEPTFKCDTYIPLPVAAMPEVPIDKIKNLQSKSEKEIQSILVSHIKELREYISNKKKQDAEHYQSYLESCAISLKWSSVEMFCKHSNHHFKVIYIHGYWEKDKRKETSHSR